MEKMASDTVPPMMLPEYTSAKKCAATYMREYITIHAIQKNNRPNHLYRAGSNMDKKQYNANAPVLCPDGKL